MAEGLVYILFSPNSPLIKIGGTADTLDNRVRGINSSANYGPAGPWTAASCLKVVDWRLVEGKLHDHFKIHKNKDIEGTNELFAVQLFEAKRLLELTDPELRVGILQANKLFLDNPFRDYICKLFEISGLFGCMDLQGAWALSLYPSTSGGRYFTLNIGTHEFAFSSKNKRVAPDGNHMIVMDQMIFEYTDAVNWIESHSGEFYNTPYKSAKERSVAVSLPGDFSIAEQFLSVVGVRRSIIAYWQDWLSEMRNRETSSFFSRFHNYEAAQALYNYRRIRAANIVPNQTK